MNETERFILEALVLLTTLSLIGGVIAAAYCLWVYANRNGDSDMWRRQVRWIKVGLIVSVSLVAIAGMDRVGRPLPSFWVWVIILAALNVFPLWVINTARTWKRYRKGGHM
jgi:cell division protein FtsW (lipid II flippase)